METYQTIDIQNWNRRDTYLFYRDFDDPFFNLCTQIDITHLIPFCKTHAYSLNLALLFHALQTANETEAFKLRILEEKVVRYDRLSCGSTVLHQDHTFSFCYFDYQEQLVVFDREGKKRIRETLSNQSFEPKEDMLSVIHFSVIPWISFTSFKHARKFGTSDTIPKIVFGKYVEEENHYKLPISIEVHHALIDGWHVGQYLHKLQEKLDRLNI